MNSVSESLLSLAVGCSAIFSVGYSSCPAATISFTQLTNNGTESPVAQLSADVSDAGTQVLFKFVNAAGGGAIASRISEVYWDDDLGLLSSGPIVDGASTSAGVDLSNVPASPANLPAGNPFGFQADFSAGRKMAAANGVDPGEMAGFLFDGDANAVIAALGTGELRLGMHVISIGNAGQSESFMTHPEPGTSVLALLASGFGVAIRRTGRAG